MCTSLLDVCEHVSSVYMCRERVAKGGNYTSPGEQRIIAVEWHDHTDGWKGRWKEKGWEGDWKRGANKKLDRVVSGEKLRGRRWRCRNTEWRRATATSTRSASFQHVINTGKREARFNERTRFVVYQSNLIYNKNISCTIIQIFNKEFVVGGCK